MSPDICHSLLRGGIIPATSRSGAVNLAGSYSRLQLPYLDITFAAEPPPGLGWAKPVLAAWTIP